jgi:poly-beta-1,6-N-acetyl-D-glucosamine N-deacetylase
MNEFVFGLALAIGVLTAGAAAPRAQSTALPAVHPKARRDYSAILMWHDVVAKKKEVWFDTTVAELDAQFRAIKKAGLTPIRLDQLANHLEKGTPVPPGAVVLTFDDNNLGLYQNLFPLLKKYRWPAAMFVHTDFIGVKTGKDHCTWDQLREMEKSGLVQVYPHTASHPPDLRTVSEKQLRRELVDARRKMEMELGGSRPFFAYSEGHFDDRVARAVWKSGYRIAITEDWGAAEASRNLFVVHRYSMHKRAEQAVRDMRRELLKRKTGRAWLRSSSGSKQARLQGSTTSK